jgi:hypothetical protein
MHSSSAKQLSGRRFLGIFLSYGAIGQLVLRQPVVSCRRAVTNIDGLELHLTSFGWLKHWSGGEWRRVFYMSAADPDKLLDSYDSPG